MFRPIAAVISFDNFPAIIVIYNMHNSYSKKVVKNDDGRYRPKHVFFHY